ncbi:MAG: hypothetical protein DHS20C06_08080 [Hyphobacterium sp.]|nr:MAG: hypothetical protein DHS20C06_08080 [Hyphobacterium sp.]
MPRTNAINRITALTLAITTLVATMLLIETSNRASIYLDTDLVSHSVEGGTGHESL